MGQITIPPKNRVEWRKLLTGQISYEYKNYVLQTKTYQMRKDIEAGKISIQQAVDNLYLLCSKYALAVQFDFKQIFKSW